MTTAAALLAALDAALPPDDAPALPGTPEAERRDAGLRAATGLNALLVREGCGWDALIAAPGSRLAKLCGRLGSDFEGERAAAYDHAVRLLHRHGARWSDLVRLRPGLAEAQASIALPQAVLPPEADWPSTVRGLRSRRAWRCAGERELLDALEDRLAAGRAVADAEARLLRDMWWSAELAPMPPEVPQEVPPEVPHAVPGGMAAEAAP